MTATGMSIGTPAYMSPEQIRADKIVDARSDVWSIGVILYEVLAGKLPFEASSHSAVFVKIVTEPPVPLQVALPGVSAELAAVVEKCLEPRADKRYASASDLARALRAIVGVSPPDPARAPDLVPPSRAEPAPPVDMRPPASSQVPDLDLSRAETEAAAEQGPRAAGSGPLCACDRRRRPERSNRPDERSAPRPRHGPKHANPADPFAAGRARATHGMLRNDVVEEPEAPVRSLASMAVMWMIVLALTRGR